jgi:protocatechuate 3,4-dioxygenase beta subunit
MLWLITAPLAAIACVARRETTPSPDLPTGAPATAAAGPKGPPTAAAQVAVPSCVVRPAQTEGPFFFDEKLERSDIRSDPNDGTTRPGVLLRLTIRAARIAGSSCTALSGAVVDLWQCDATGDYSDVPGSATAGKKFLRGYQLTDANGVASFLTIYPGWYPGRAVHIHFKIRTAGAGAREFVSQLYFDDALTDRVHAQAPYVARGQGRTRNSADGPYRNGGDRLLLPLAPDAQGYAGTFDIGLDLA